MADQPDNLVLELLRSIRADQTAMRSDMAELRAETNLKIGSFAQGMVSMRKDINDLGKHVDDLRDTVQGLRADVRMIALAVDEHTHRLDKMEAYLITIHS